MQYLQNLKLVAKSHIDNHEMPAARDLLLQACAEQDVDAEIWFLLGLVEAALGSTELAVEYLQKSIQMEQSSPVAHFHLALAKKTLGQLAEAARHFEDCLDLDPGHHAARLEVSDLYYRLGNLERSARHLEVLLQEDPHNLQFLLRYAYNRLSLGMLDQASEYFNRLLQERPDAVVAVAGLSDICIKQGNYNRALGLLEPFLGSDPVYKGIALNFSKICHHEGRCQEAVRILEQVRVDLEASGEDTYDVLFALGRLYDKVQKYEQAFASYSRANRMRNVQPADMARLARQTEAFIDTWSLEFDAGLPRANICMGQVQPIFIVGMPRSGTSLVEQILASHPAVHGAGELKDIGLFIQQLQNQFGASVPYPACLQLAGRACLNEFAAGYLEKLASMGDEGCLMVTDKLPGNFWNLGLIRRLFPAGKIIHCVRNPLDTCLSCYFTDFSEGHEFAFELRKLGEYYGEYRKIMRHWRDVIGIPMFENQYEELANDPEAASRRLVEYCGLEWDEACLAPHKTRRDVTTASYSQVRERIYTSSVGRWKHYDRYLGPLREALHIKSPI